MQKDLEKYEDDMYLDIVVTPSGNVVLLDEDELKEAYNKNDISKEEYDNAYEEANKMLKLLDGKKDNLQKYTDAYLKQFKQSRC